MIRLALLGLFCAGIAVYAWKDWYRSLCGLILLMAVIEHPDMPKNMFGVQGLNPWNILLFVILLAWLSKRGTEQLGWDLPRPVTSLLILYMGLLVVSTVRMFLDPTGLEGITLGYLIGEGWVNTFKWVVPGVLLFTGCRSRERLLWGVGATLGVYILLGLLIKWMPPSTAMNGSELAARSLKVLGREVGYHRVNLSMMLAGASWASLAMRPLFKRAFWPMVGFLGMAYAQALTGGRAGYVTWGCLGLVLCLIRWRRYLLLAPAVALGITLFAPGVVDRMVEGFTVQSRDSNVLIEREVGAATRLQEGADEYTITAGRSFAWVFVVEKIWQAPIVGYGRQAMVRTGLFAFLLDRYGETFPHPHNAYLELLLDNGVLGFLLVVPFFLVVVVQSLSLLRDDTAREFTVAGGLAAALVLAFLVASMGSQTFYPREGAVGMWCGIGLMWRVGVQRSLMAKAGTSDVWLSAGSALAVVPAMGIGVANRDAVSLRRSGSPSVRGGAAAGGHFL
jgi:O-antigen ligase